MSMMRGIFIKVNHTRFRFFHVFLLKALCLLVVLSGAMIPFSLGVAVTVEEAPLDIQVREVAKTLRCAVCQSESIWESNAGLARQMRDVIREQLRQGRTPDEIRTYFVGRYGEYILLRPSKSGLNWILWAGPFILLFIGGFFLYRTASRWVTQTASEKPEEVPPISDQERKRIEKELHLLEK